MFPGELQNLPGCKIPTGEEESREESTVCPSAEFVLLCIKRIKDSLSYKRKIKGEYNF